MKKFVKRMFDDSAALDRADDVSDSKARDGLRGRPDFDLQDWATRRGLDFRGQTAQAGYYSVTSTWSVDVIWNVVRGRLPGGTYGVLCHEVRLLEGDTRGLFHGTKTEWSGFGSLVRDDNEYFKVPYTNAGVRAPHLGPITGLHVARHAERYIGSSSPQDIWTTRDLDDLGLSEWVASTRKHSDLGVAEQLVTGPVRDILSVQRGLGFELHVEYGQGIASRQDFLRTDEELDELAEIASTLGAAVRDVCVTTPTPPLTTEVEPPVWAQEVRGSPSTDTFTSWPIGALVDRVVHAADERGLALEDPRTFHETFPGLNFPGEAFGVLRGRFPGTEIDGRLLACAERRMSLPDDIARLLTDPGGQAGCDVAIVAVAPDTPATAPEGEIEQDMRLAIADGVLTSWRPRPTWQATGETLDTLGRDTAAAITRRGITPA